jgi:hypothetical protein
MLSVMTHLTLIDTNWFSTIIAIFGKHIIETSQTIRFALTHYITLTTELLIAIETCKMFHVPRSTLSLGTFIGKNDLNGGKKTKNGKDMLIEWI